jgi:hypothetical protein
VRRYRASVAVLAFNAGGRDLEVAEADARVLAAALQPLASFIAIRVSTAAAGTGGRERIVLDRTGAWAVLQALESVLAQGRRGDTELTDGLLDLRYELMLQLGVV